MPRLGHNKATRGGEVFPILRRAGLLSSERGHAVTIEKAKKIFSEDGKKTY